MMHDQSVWKQAADLAGARWGRQPVTPGDTPLEQATSLVVQPRPGKHAARLFAALRSGGDLDLLTLGESSADEIVELLPAGTAPTTARRLRDFLRLLSARFDGSLEALFERSDDLVRETLRGVKGLGTEIVDKLLLAIGRRNVLPLNTAVQRVGRRHGWLDAETDLNSARESLAASLADWEPDEVWQLHALLDRVGKEFCRARPNCDACPLAPLLPAGGPRQPEW